MAETTSIRIVTFACACRHVTGSFKIPERNLPLSLTLCHCYTCRHQSGLMAITNASLPAGTEFDVKGPTLEVYKASEELSRFFCKNCGAHVYMEDKEAKKEICTGVSEGVGEGKGEGLLRLDQHIYVKDTKDGGVRDWLPDVDAWEEFTDVSEKLDKGWKDESLNASSLGKAQELQAHCRCKGVSFKITRPDEGSAGISAPRGDIAGPPPPTTTKEDRISSAWWLSDNGTKYLAGTCACSTCRLTSGYDIQTWAFVPKANILQLDGTPLDFGAGTLKRYNSSKGVYREFCSKCGATVFYHADRRPDLIDVSVGLLDAEEGTRAESWLGWKTDRVSHEEDAQNKDLIKKLGDGLKRWGEAKGNQVSREA